MALLALYAYLLYLMLVAMYGRMGALLVGGLSIGVLTAGLYITSRRYRGMTEDERTALAMRPLQDQRWPGSAYALLPGDAGREQDVSPNPAEGDHRNSPGGAGDTRSID